jgi:phosphatidylserine/phosphatidylglycerophosphate/cardiolipin synthase-like enzyme
MSKKTTIPAYPVTSAVLLESQDYMPYVFDKIDSAKSRIWASIFIIDARAEADEQGSVRALIEKLAYAAWRRVDVRVIVGTASIVDVYVACLASAYYMKKQGINVRGFSSQAGRRSTHSKYMLFDESSIVVGSNNWSHNSFHLAVNSSIAIESKGLAENLGLEFNTAWQTSNEIIYES